MIGSGHGAAADLGSALRGAAGVDGALLLGAVALGVAALETVALLSAQLAPWVLLLARVGPAALLYAVFLRWAAGHRGLPGLDGRRRPPAEPASAAARVAALLLWPSAALAGAVLLTVGPAAFVERYHLNPAELLRRQDVWGYVVFLFALLQLPPAAVASAWRGRALPLLDPTYGLRAVAADARAYAPVHALVALLAVAGYALDGAGDLLRHHLALPFAGAVLRHLLALWAPLVQACLLGAYASRAAARGARAAG